MNWKETAKNLIGGAKQKKGVIIKGGKVTGFREPVTSRPVTPEPNYICKNCGMLIESCHGHTREECGIYQDNPTNPDLRAHKTILPGRNDPKVKLPYYQSEEKWVPPKSTSKHVDLIKPYRSSNQTAIKEEKN